MGKIISKYGKQLFFYTYNLKYEWSTIIDEREEGIPIPSDTRNDTVQISATWQVISECGFNL